MKQGLAFFFFKSNVENNAPIPDLDDVVLYCAKLCEFSQKPWLGFSSVSVPWIFYNIRSIFHRRRIKANWTESQKVYCLIGVLLPPVATESCYKGHSFPQLSVQVGHLID